MVEVEVVLEVEPVLEVEVVLEVEPVLVANRYLKLNRYSWRTGFHTLRVILKWCSVGSQRRVPLRFPTRVH